MLNTDIRQIIREKLEKIKPYLTSNNITAYRLISSSYRFPLTVDIYQNNSVIHVVDLVKASVLSELEEVLRNQLQVTEYFYKDRTKQGLTFLPAAPKKIVQEEYGHKFIINLSDYLDTGLFLDHRETRHWLGGLCRDKEVLNTFAYTGSFSVYAAAAGATKTFSVDISKVYCQWIKDNLEINNLPLETNWIYKMDTMEFFSYARKKKLVFDIIVIDPPTFSQNKGRSFAVQSDHVALINEALGLLKPSGFILFSTNFKEFQINRKELSQCQIKEKLDTLPPDFAGTQPFRCFIITKPGT